MNQCSICLEAINQSEKVTIVDCNHSYCGECIYKLFDRNILNCPLCRGKIQKYLYKDEIIHLVVREVNSQNTDTDNSDILELELFRVSIARAKFIIAQWFLLIIMFIILVNYSETNKTIETDNLNLEDRNEYLTQELEECNSKTSNHVLIDVIHHPGVVGGRTFYCPFPEYYVNRCFDGN
jgi:hypothetical protein